MDSTPRPNGYGSAFFIKCSDIVKGDLVEVLTRLLKRGFEEGRIGCFSHPRVIFVNGGKRSIKELRKVLGLYENWSGQKINKEKTAIFFSKNCSVTRKGVALRESSFKEGQFPVIYLGVPVVQGRLTARHLEPLVEKIRKKIAGWKLQLLSQGGRLVLLRHVLTCMATHLLSVLNVPKSIFKRLNSILSSFFWGEVNGRTRKKWCCWDKLCKPVVEGGIGVRKFEDV
ncbi:uncharacterized protein LOC111409474 [Olea europaea var. sylvestris]|uniref:uncharacterized protein LOC111409474 n=1 Tax=Olea europaea var. sylvestris TaxID=158386 RepID=UPI000C1D7740|nr:uncharacterized protein LOC111409474 [Olea europaea var. sylvestris]